MKFNYTWILPVLALTIASFSTPLYARADSGPLGNYNVLIADEGNNRLIEVTPDKRIVWSYTFSLPKMGTGADDAFFTDNGKSIITNLEEMNQIQVIDYATKKVIWKYGQLGKAGSAAGLLNTPDDAYKLPNGNITVADIKNCRVIEIAPDKSIVRQYGVTKKCGNTGNLLNKPNGDTPLPNGNTFIDNIVGHSLIELDKNWNKIFSMNLPIEYPSDPQLTRAGNILVAGYTNPGRIIEVQRDGKVVWEYTGDRKVKLNEPSLAIELPNGNIMANDDANHRVIVIDKQTKNIIWQYGVTKKAGIAAGYLHTPDGVDIIQHPDRIGAITRHPSSFINKHIFIQGYILKKENGYVIFSDEPNGTISKTDLPVAGAGIDSMVMNQIYILEGIFTDHGLSASNGSIYHLDLSALPKSIIN